MYELFAAVTTTSVDAISAPSLPVESIFEAILTFILTFQLSEYLVWIKDAYFWFKVLSTFLCLLLFAGVIMVNIKIAKLHQKVREQDEKERTVDIKAAEESVHTKRWRKVLEHIESQNPNDWRLAILEADILLDDMLKEQGRPGETLGERLKSLDRATFLEHDKAWEAHKIRNLIAHEGTNFTLPHREARRIVSLYQDVLRYGNYI